MRSAHAQNSVQTFLRVPLLHSKYRIWKTDIHINHVMYEPNNCCQLCWTLQKNPFLFCIKEVHIRVLNFPWHSYLNLFFRTVKPERVASNNINWANRPPKVICKDSEYDKLIPNSLSHEFCSLQYQIHLIKSLLWSCTESID